MKVSRGFLYVVRLGECFGGRDRDNFVAGLTNKGIGCGRYFAPIHRQPAYADVEVRHALPVTDAVSERVIALPFSNRITEEQIEIVCNRLMRAVERLM